MSNPVELTPAQIEFLQSALSGFTKEKWTIELAGAAGSQRKFIRVRQPEAAQSYILVVWDSRDEDWPRFISIQADLADRLPFLPVVYGKDDRHGLILEEDLGNQTLKRFCSDPQNSKDDSLVMYRLVLQAMVQWHSVGESQCKAIGERALDLTTFLWESSYFARHCVTEFCGCDRLLTRDWDRERAKIAADAAALAQVCVHRDFQSENILIYKGQIRFVDFQGARLGPSPYDAASLLYDPYVDIFDDQTIDSLASFYKSELYKCSDYDFYICAAQRLMQALGAYGNLSIHKGKDWYRAYIPVALRRLGGVLRHLPHYPHIAEIVTACTSACMPKAGAV